MSECGKTDGRDGGRTNNHRQEGKFQLLRLDADEGRPANALQEAIFNYVIGLGNEQLFCINMP